MAKELKEYGKEVSDFRQTIGVGPETRLVRDLQALEQHRHLVNAQRPGLSKALGDGLFELKTKCAKENLELRCFYGFVDGEIVILLCCVKKKQKADPSWISTARKRLAELKRGKWIPKNVTLH